MFRIAWKSLLGRKLRLVMSAFSIVLGVAFVVGSLMFTNLLSSSFDSLLMGSVADVNVMPAPAANPLAPPGEGTIQISEELVSEIGALDGVAEATGLVSGPNFYPLDAEGNLMVDDGRGMFRVEEEVLEVPGMTRDIFEKLRRFVHAQPDASGELNLLAAPESLLNAWRDVDAAAVDFAMESRQDVARDGAAPMGPLAPLALAGATIYCVDVEVVIAGNRSFQQRIWVDMATGADGLPWRFTRVYPLAMRSPNSQEAQFAI